MLRRGQRELRPCYLLNDPVATKAGHELCRRGHREVSLQVHLPVLTSFLHKVEAGHARPERHKEFISAATCFTFRYIYILMPLHLKDCGSKNRWCRDPPYKISTPEPSHGQRHS